MTMQIYARLSLCKPASDVVPGYSCILKKKQMRFISACLSLVPVVLLLKQPVSLITGCFLLLSRDFISHVAYTCKK